MRVGILTFHRAHNYGAVLQCYALQQYLISRGDDAYVIDYNKKELWSYYHWRERGYEKYVTSNLIKFPYRLLQYLHAKKNHIIRYYKFVLFQKKYLRLAPVDSIQSSPYDLILIGSDQVWNTSITHGFDKYYWGQFERPSSTKVATYAASLMKLWDEKDYITIHNYLSRLDAISVREYPLKRYLNSIFTDLKVSDVPDPVLLLPPNEWKRITKRPNRKSPYYFFYQAQKSDSIYKSAQTIAKERGRDLVVLSADVNAVNTPECHSASPLEFLGWILYAELVITSSFHALAFCILFQKPFYAIRLNNTQDERLNNLVKLFGLEDRLIDNESQCKELNPFEPKETQNHLRGKAAEYLCSLLN